MEEKLKEPTVTEKILVEEDPVKPRRLTEEEIQNILSVIPLRKSVLENLGEQLKEIIITPLGINDLQNEILRQFNEAIDMITTEAPHLGQIITPAGLILKYK